MKISLQRLSLNKSNIKKNLPLPRQGREGEDDEKEREGGRKRVEGKEERLELPIFSMLIFIIVFRKFKCHKTKIDGN